MPVLERYNEELARLGREYREKALEALERGDERAHSVYMMQHSMFGDMLRTIGRVEHEKTRPGYAANVLASLAKEEQKYLAAQDFDLADRARVKAQTICRALEILERLEKEDA